MWSLLHEVLKLKHFTTGLSLKRLNFNPSMISAGIIGLKNASLIFYVLSLANHLGGKLGCWGGGGGSFPLPPPVDRTLTIVVTL